MNNDAQIARDTAKSELEKQERQVYEERKKREMELAEVRKEAEEKTPATWTYREANCKFCLKFSLEIIMILGVSKSTAHRPKWVGT